MVNQHCKHHWKEVFLRQLGGNKDGQSTLAGNFLICHIWKYPGYALISLESKEHLMNRNILREYWIEDKNANHLYILSRSAY